MSKWYRFKKWMSYRRLALSRHGVHSPFVYQFMNEVLLKSDRMNLKEPIVAYFKAYDIRQEQWDLKGSTANTLILLSNIHNSPATSEQWNSLIASSRVTLSIDLYNIGLLFFSKDFREKQHFVLK